ncbi:AMIN domain-containing protein [Sphaerospermopsis aphanizomenoides BCCUSP55]|uniref:AMIN domain-containing protein n=1 Tax=Sphaerospermopsis aphanizomenoides TaxID=459663 RepID=UPI000A69D437|nr:AMIN domain-containing protein [Sphaerospermopsis aphanizomenoides]MBK1988350.1 AMIN domain-containing protein [Sphaerospermopsis aphanizomenoides BCCUSP55]
MKNKLRTRKFSPSYLLRISLLSLCAGITLNNSISLAVTTAKLNKWQFNPQSQQLEITLSASTNPEYFYLAEPPRLVVDLPNTQLGNVDTHKNYSGKIQKIRVSQFSPNITRIVIDLEPGSFVDTNQVKLQPISPKNPTRWVLSPIISHNSTSAINQPSSNPFLTLPPPTTNLPINQKPFVIVPPLNSQNPSSLSNLIILPANSPNTSENRNLITAPNSQNYVQPVPNIPIIEFGQPLPNTK